MKSSFIVLGISLLLSSPTFAQDDLVPATSEDIKEFDDQVSNTESNTSTTNNTEDSADKERKENFGAAVSAEAKRLKTLPKEERGKMGQWVSAQRRKNGDKKPNKGEASAVDSTMGGSADARVSAPGHKKGQGGSHRSNRKQ